MPVAHTLVRPKANRGDVAHRVAPLVALFALAALICVAIALGAQSGTPATSHGRFGPPTVAAPAHSHVAPAARPDEIKVSPRIRR